MDINKIHFDMIWQCDMAVDSHYMKEISSWTRIEVEKQKGRIRMELSLCSLAHDKIRVTVLSASVCLALNLVPYLCADRAQHRHSFMGMLPLLFY